jgi:hypothetical protein
MLSYKKGRPIAFIVGGYDDGEILHVYEEDNDKKSDEETSEETSEESSEEDITGISLPVGKFSALLNPNERSVSYIAGPSGSGKTTYALNLVKSYAKIHPKKIFYLFSRTDYKQDPAYKGLRANQIMLDETLISDPIDITQELTTGSIVLFDDCNTIQNDALKKVIDKLMGDMMEIGRKLDITIIITNHLVIPNEKKIARTIMNELQSLTCFPRCGSAQQIGYALRTYFGLNRKQIAQIINIPSRWVTISKSYPMYVLYETGCFIL